MAQSPGLTARVAIRNVSKSFGAVTALDDVSFDLMPGEIHALVGENGAGKSTLVGVLTGLHEADSGTVEIDGVPAAFRTPLDARAAGIAAVYQDPNLFPHLSVAENILTAQLPRRGMFVDHAAMRRRATELLQRVGYPVDVDATVATLTVAEAQFVEIARAMSSDLRVLILDEPTSALTPTEATRLYDVVRALRDAGTTVVWISHRMEEIRMLADTITVLRDGGHVTTVPAAQLDDDQMIRLMVGRHVELVRPAGEAPTAGEVRLAVEGLTVPGEFSDVSFEVRAGEIVGVAGLVGAGRTEVVETIFGLRHASAGTVMIDGKVVTSRSPRAMARRGVSLLPEHRDADGVIPEMTIGDNVALPSISRLQRLGLMLRSRERALAARQVADLQVKGSIDDLVSSLSGGNRQKVALGRWLATNPRILLLDEPTHGIDIGTKAQVHEIMRNLAHVQRMAILMISSDMVELLAVSDRILVMARGRMVADVVATDATQESILAAATSRSLVAAGAVSTDGDR